MVDLAKIKPEHLWYFVGLIATDGNLSKDGRHITLTSKDRGHLFLVQKAIGLKGTIGLKARGGSKDKIYSILQFSNVNFYKYLESIGLTARKSLTIGELQINKNYWNDFIRGVIDGDGYITGWTNGHNGLRQWSVGIVSASITFLKWLKIEIEDKYKVNGRIFSRTSKNKVNPMYSLRFGKLAGKIILGQIYYENSLCLERKQARCQECLLDKNRMLKYGNVVMPGC